MYIIIKKNGAMKFERDTRKGLQVGKGRKKCSNLFIVSKNI